MAGTRADLRLQGVTNYLTQLQYKAATQDDLWRHLTEQGHKDGTLAQEMDVKTVMDTWTLQMGFPLVTVTRQYGDNTARVEQTRFLVGDKVGNCILTSLSCALHFRKRTPVLLPDEPDKCPATSVPPASRRWHTTATPGRRAASAGGCP